MSLFASLSDRAHTRVHGGMVLVSSALVALVVTGCSCEHDVAPPTCVWDEPETCRIETKVKIKWKLSIPCNCSPGGPTIGLDGTIYFAVGGKFTQPVLYAVGPAGKVKWKRALKSLAEDDMCNTPVVGPDGSVHVTSDDGYLHRFSPDGKLQWKLKFDGPFDLTNARLAARPVVASSGEIYVVAADRQVYAVNAKGKVRWRYKMQYLGTKSEVDPVLADGRLFVPVSIPPQITALDVNNGKELWKQNLDGVVGSVGSQLPLTTGEHVLTTWFGKQSVAMALSKQSGKEIWRHALPSPPFAGPVSPHFIAPDGTVYTFMMSEKAPPYNGSFTYLQGLNKTGKPLFRAYYSKTEVYSTTWSMGPLGADGELYAMAVGNGVLKDGKIITPQRLISYSVHERRFKTLFDLADYKLTPTSPALLPDGTLLFFTADDGKGATNTHLIAVQTRSAGLARSGWPKDGHDNRNSGDVSTPLID